MSRRWIARKTTEFDAAAVRPEAYASPYPVFRAGPEAAAARREVLRLLTGFTLLALPLHCGIGWLAGHSLGLATAAVLVTVAATLAVAVARWLGHDELLQRLPLLLVLGLVGVGLVFVSSLPTSVWQGGGLGLIGVLLLIITVVSVLGSLYRPLAATYQTVTLKIPFRDLCVAAAAMLVSLGLAAASQSCPRVVPPVLACALAGGLAGLVVVEYAAWARANPSTSLERGRAFDGPVADAGGKPRRPAGPIDGRAALLGAGLFGLCYGLVSTLPSHGAEWLRLLRPPEGWSQEQATEALAAVFGVGLVGMPCGWVWASSALNGLRLMNPLVAPRVAWDALAVFLTYPEAAHPLAHRISTPWLRPLSVRLGGAGVVLAAVATASTTPPESPKAAPETAAAPAARPAAPPPQRPRAVIPEDDGVGPGWGGNPFGNSPFDRTPPGWGQPPEPPAVIPESRPLGDGVPRFVRSTLVAAVAGPVLLYTLVVVLGAAVLPTYFHYFESPQSSALPR